MTVTDELKKYSLVALVVVIAYQARVRAGVAP